jgi:hypothetical protein
MPEKSRPALLDFGALVQRGSLDLIGALFALGSLLRHPPTAYQKTQRVLAFFEPLNFAANGKQLIGWRQVGAVIQPFRRQFCFQVLDFAF